MHTTKTDTSILLIFEDGQQGVEEARVLLCLRGLCQPEISPQPLPVITYGLQLDLCLPAVVGIGCKRGFNATPQAGSVHGDASGSVAVRRPAMCWKNRMVGGRDLKVWRRG
jgi:hypothetical protein